MGLPYHKPIQENAIRKSSFSAEQTILALKQTEHGTPVAEVIRIISISEQAYSR